MKNSQVRFKRTFAHNFKQFCRIFLASIVTAVAVEVFLLPSNAILGGVLGISSIMDILLTGLSADKWYFSAGIWLVLINVPIIIYCFCRSRKRFAVKTTVYLLLLGSELVVMRACNVAVLLKSVISANGIDDKVVYVLLGGALHGISLPLLLSVNASTGGTDIVGLIVQKYSKKSSSDALRFILAANAVVITFASVVYGVVNKTATEAINMFIYSMAALFVCEIVQETIFKGFSSAVELEITTSKPAEMAEQLTSQLKHGLTSVKVKGGYSHEEKEMLLCVIRKQQLVRARRIINQVDPHAFAYVENVKEVIGKGFTNKEMELEEDETAQNAETDAESVSESTPMDSDAQTK